MRNYDQIAHTLTHTHTHTRGFAEGRSTCVDKCTNVRTESTLELNESSSNNAAL